jgi:amidohydrolase
MFDVWQHAVDNAKTLRHQLHQEPEIAWQETRTAETIRTQLGQLGIPWRPCADTGTVARLNPKGRGAPHIALRGDIDALPIEEQTGKAWMSRSPGMMHACGHDGHTATLVATAAWLKACENQLQGPVSLIFQPAEEGGHGARRMIEDGALEEVDKIFGWHNWPAIPFGHIACPDGLVMCGNATFRITINGKGGHASQPELCRDPVLAGSAITLALQQIVSRRLPPQQATVVSVTSIEAQSGDTIIPQQAILSGSIRMSEMSARDSIFEQVESISQHTARAYGVDAEVVLIPRYYPTINHAGEACLVRQLWAEEFGEPTTDPQTVIPVMASEDFSYYLREIPGAFVLVGADDGPDHQYPCHSPHYDFNDRLTPLVMRLYSRLAGIPVPVNR